jgi:amidase
MSFKMPSTNQVCELGDSLGTDVTGDYANSFINFVQSFAGGHGLLASLPDDVPAIKDPRGPSYRKATITVTAPGSQRRTSKARAAASSPAKTAAVKDPCAVAGIPRTNGALVLEGFVPEFDALSRGRRIRTRRQLARTGTDGKR